LNATPLTPEQHGMLRVVSSSGSLLLTLLSDVLDLAKIEAGEMALEPLAFDAIACIEDVCGLFGASAAQKGVVLDVAIDESLSRWRLGDAMRIRQILQNLLSNAVKFTDAGSIRVSACPGSAPDQVCISVSDTGIGMDEDQIGQLFSRFRQADGSISRRFGGTGLGLAIAQDLAQLMGGQISVNSAKGVGSQFVFTAPLPATEPMIDTATADDVAAVAAIRVLAADDNETNRIVLRTLLGQLGIDVDLVHDGCEAVQAAALMPYDVILMDVHMPVQDGLHATRAIRAGDGPNRATPIIALTADALEKTIEACRAAGMQAHCEKPIVPARLLAAIQTTLEAAVGAVEGEDQPPLAANAQSA
jgi:CheY-like chemotaxis protein/anti-sigma regulatory factor (Ser/Thr protein kinase)